MRDCVTAIGAFLSGLGLPCWMAGHCPQDAGFPRLIWQAEIPGGGEAGSLRLEAWFRGPEAQAERFAFLDRLERAVPRAGRRIPCGGGCLLVRRGLPYGSFAADRVHPGLLGARASLSFWRCGQ